MHYNRDANPLLISGIAAQLAVALQPVPLAVPLPSADSERFAVFRDPSAGAFRCTKTTRCASGTSCAATEPMP